MTALETMGVFVARGVRGSVPAPTRSAVRRHVMDTVAAWVAGARTLEGRALIDFRSAAAGDETARDIGIHCAQARLSEADNIHLASTTTPGGIVIPAAMTLAAAHPGVTADALIEAVVAGTEAMVRLGHAIGGPTVLYRGIWPTYFAAPFAVAAVTARLHDLDASQTANALALALTFASPGVGHHNAQSSARWFAIGQAARNGFVAAQAARAGFTSDLNLLDGAFLDGIYGIKPDAGALTSDLGGQLAIDDTSFKPWCAARQTIAATQALLELIEDGLSPDAIASVEINVPPPYFKMIDHGVRAGDRISHLTSVQYSVALAACDPAALYDVQRLPERTTGQVQAVMQNITVSADPALLTHYPKAWPARVVVHTAGGRRERLVLHVPGDPQRPFDDGAVAAKARRILAGVEAAHVDDLLKLCVSVSEDRGAPAALLEMIARLTRSNAAERRPSA